MKKIITLIFVLGTIVTTFSQTFEDSSINYEIIANNPAEVKVIRSPNVEESIIIPEQVSYKSKKYTVVAIDRFAFGLTQLLEVQLPDSIVSIGEFAFVKTNITEISLPRKLQIIEANAFKNTDLYNITIKGEEFVDAAFDAFADVEIDTITVIVPKSSVFMYRNAAVWEDFGLITTAEDNFREHSYVNTNK